MCIKFKIKVLKILGMVDFIAKGFENIFKLTGNKKNYLLNIDTSSRKSDGSLCL